MAHKVAHKAKAAASKPKPLDKDALQRKEIIRTIKGAGIQRMVEMIPALGAYEDPYATVMQSPDLLYACLQLFRQRRERFQDLLVDEDGNPVTENDKPLKCGRTVDQIVGMVVRSGAKAYAEKRFGAPTPAAAKPPVKPETRSLLEKLAALVSLKWEPPEPPHKTVTVSQAERWYAAIKDALDYDWQVPLIPHFCELPVKLIAEMGRGVTTLHTPEAIAALADIGRHSMDQARRILSDEMMREMLDTQPLAAKGIAFLGKERYEYMHSVVYDKMGENFWEMCMDCDRLEVMEQQNAKDLEQMADYLHIISADTINEVVRHLQFAFIPIFLDVAHSKLGPETFAQIFGIPGNRKLIKLFCEKAAAYKLDPADPTGDLRARLPDVFAAYLRAPRDFERGL